MSWLHIKPLNLRTVVDLRDGVQRALEKFSHDLERESRHVQRLEVMLTVRRSTTLPPNAFVPYDPSSGAMVLIMPPTVGNNGAQILAANITDSTNTVTFEPASGDSVSGANTNGAARGSSWFVCDEAGARWVRVF